jgi:hypothetical protein
MSVGDYRYLSIYDRILQDIEVVWIEIWSFKVRQQVLGITSGVSYFVIQDIQTTFLQYHFGCL